MTWQLVLAALLSIGVGVTATMHVRIERMNVPKRVHAFQPLTLFLLAMIALLAPQAVSVGYKGAIVLALLISAAIGLLVMIPGTPLVISLATSLVVYFLYMVAFASENALGIPTP
ncbi:MAG: hypothetical protein HC802_18605, partial [Caldilineaceae bacterium]|nr:hypothetical protein [Caldilineaceae bacterium]